MNVIQALAVFVIIGALMWAALIAVFASVIL
jgi:hypothetical protein